MTDEAMAMAFKHTTGELKIHTTQQNILQIIIILLSKIFSQNKTCFRLSLLYYLQVAKVLCQGTT